MSTRYFGLVALVCACYVSAFGQMSCNTDKWPVQDACMKTTTYHGGDFAPSGLHCYCDGVPRSALDCYLVQCSRNKPTNSCPTAGSPICLATGNTFITQSDISVPGLGGGLNLTRTWNSILPVSFLSVGMFGPNWRSNYEERVYLDTDNTVAYARGDGTLWSFVYDASQNFKTASPANTGATLHQGSTSWVLTFKNGDQRTFDTGGKLISITDRNGNTTQLTYDSLLRLTTVTDAAGRHLYFSYATSGSTLVTSVTTDVGLSLAYTYDGQGRLSQYTKPDNTTVSFQYNDTNPILITAVLDSDSKILESHTYDSQSRGLTSSRANGIDSLSITYQKPSPPSGP